MKKPLSIFLSILFLFYCFPVSAVAGNSEAQFNNAVSLLRENKFTEASEAFAELGNYPEAPRYAMYCKALAMAEKHQYSTAIKNLKHLTGFLDSDLLVIYFEGLWNENFEEYFHLFHFSLKIIKKYIINNKLLNLLLNQF